MRKLIIVLVAVVTALFMATAPAGAGAPKFHSATGSVTNSGALTVSFDERGLGNENIDYTLTADASAVYACINGGGNHPQAANKETINSEVSANGSFEAKNGRVQASLTTAAPSAGGFSCPRGQRLVLASVTYTNILLTDTTNGVSTSIPDTSKTFFAV
ncbi:hypothetical protein [Lentzea kentuckyensis]|uniref:hypothetical protein n=1 Tax=Lentzea kentuckyensis TaxID=360086 RepID=UPI001B803004|nr:hypothetical protein [Lentzea kentuckyensis]